MALEPCRCFVIPMSEIERLSSTTRVRAHLIHMLIAKTRSLVKQVRDLALRDVYGRFAKFVDDSASSGTHARGAREADAAGHRRADRGSREMVNRIVKDLIAGGYISSTQADQDPQAGCRRTGKGAGPGFPRRAAVQSRNVRFGQNRSARAPIAPEREFGTKPQCVWREGRRAAS